MCLAVPAKVITIDRDTDMATVALGEIEKQVSTALLDEVEVNDYVLVHVGYALHKISEAEAEKTLGLFAEAGLLGEQVGEQV
jgi:hydrogenase expression/formation protein HypC